MAMNINTNLQAMLVHRRLLDINRQFSTSLERLSTGLRINRPEDSPGEWGILANNKMQISSLERGVLNAQNAEGMLQTAEEALVQINGILERIHDLAVEAADSTLTSAQRNAAQDEIIVLRAEVESIVGVTEFNGVRLLADERSAAEITSTEVVGESDILRNRTVINASKGAGATSTRTFNFDPATNPSGVTIRTTLRLAVSLDPSNAEALNSVEIALSDTDSRSMAQAIENAIEQQVGGEYRIGGKRHVDVIAVDSAGELSEHAGGTDNPNFSANSANTKFIFRTTSTSEYNSQRNTFTAVRLDISDDPHLDSTGAAIGDYFFGGTTTGASITVNSTPGNDKIRLSVDGEIVTAQLNPGIYSQARLADILEDAINEVIVYTNDVNVTPVVVMNFDPAATTLSNASYLFNQDVGGSTNTLVTTAAPNDLMVDAKVIVTNAGGTSYERTITDVDIGTSTITLDQNFDDTGGGTIQFAAPQIGDQVIAITDLTPTAPGDPSFAIGDTITIGTSGETATISNIRQGAGAGSDAALLELSSGLTNAYSLGDAVNISTEVNSLTNLNGAIDINANATITDYGAAFAGNLLDNQIEITGLSGTLSIGNVVTVTDDAANTQDAVITNINGDIVTLDRDLDTTILTGTPDTVAVNANRITVDDLTGIALNDEIKIEDGENTVLRTITGIDFGRNILTLGAPLNRDLKDNLVIVTDSSEQDVVKLKLSSGLVGNTSSVEVLAGSSGGGYSLLTQLGYIVGDEDIGTGSTFSFQLGGARDVFNFEIDTLGLKEFGADGIDISGIDVSSILGAQAAIGISENAIESLGTTQTNIGAAINNISRRESIMAAHRENLVEQRTRLEEVDFSSETQNFTRLQILMQAATAILAQANIVPTTMLQLLG